MMPTTSRRSDTSSVRDRMEALELQLEAERERRLAVEKRIQEMEKYGRTPAPFISSELPPLPPDRQSVHSGVSASRRSIAPSLNVIPPTWDILAQNREVKTEDTCGTSSRGKVAAYVASVEPPSPRDNLAAAAAPASLNSSSRIKTVPRPPDAKKRPPTGYGALPTVTSPNRVRKPPLPTAARGRPGSSGGTTSSFGVLLGRRQPTSAELYIYKQRHEQRMEKLRSFDFYLPP